VRLKSTPEEAAGSCIGGAKDGGGAAGLIALGGAGRRAGGDFEGDSEIWFLSGLPERTCD